MSAALKVDIDVHAALNLLRHLPPSAMEAAWRRTLRKTGVWAKAEMAREVRQHAKIPQKVVRDRVFFYLRNSKTGKVWAGLNSIPAELLGKPRQTRTGVTAGAYQFPHAWIYRSHHKNDGNTGKVFRRTTNRRKPTERVMLDWSDQGRAAFHITAKRIEARVMDVLRQEVRFELHKAFAGG